MMHLRVNVLIFLDTIQYIIYYYSIYYTLKIAGLFLPNFGSKMDQPSHWVTFFNYIFNPTFGFVHF